MIDGGDGVAAAADGTAADEGGPDAAAAIVRARMASRVADVMTARARLLSHDGAAGDEEAVHDYRVGLRRLRSALRALRPMWGKARLVPLEGELKALADATGDVRDEEVLQETLQRVKLTPESKATLARWSQGRGRRLRGARAAAARKLAGAELGDRLSRTLHAIEATLGEVPRKPLTLHRLRERSIGRMLEDVVTRGAAVEASDVDAMHRLRIRIKRLRYAIELLFDGDAPTEPALKAATKLQKRLGELHDVDEALLRMARAWGLPPEVRLQLAAGLSALRADVARKASRDVGAGVPELQQELTVLLGDPTPQG